MALRLEWLADYIRSAIAGQISHFGLVCWNAALDNDFLELPVTVVQIDDQPGIRVPTQIHLTNKDVRKSITVESGAWVAITISGTPSLFRSPTTQDVRS